MLELIHSSDELEPVRLNWAPEGLRQSKDDATEPIVPELVLFSAHNVFSVMLLMDGTVRIKVWIQPETSVAFLRYTTLDGKSRQWLHKSHKMKSHWEVSCLTPGRDLEL